MNAPQTMWPAITTPAQHFIGNRWHAPQGRAELPMIDPSDGAPFASIARGNAADVDAAVRAAQAASDGAWAQAVSGGAGTPAGQAVARDPRSRRGTGADRGARLRQAARAGARRRRRRARATSSSTAARATSCTARRFPIRKGFAVLTWREPHGVTGHIIPWNYPLQIFGRSAGGSLAAGNACVVKPAEDACLSVLRVAALAAEIGLPAGALNIVTGLGNEAGAALVEHPGVASTCRSPARRRPVRGSERPRPSGIAR